MANEVQTALQTIIGNSDDKTAALRAQRAGLKTQVRDLHQQIVAINQQIFALEQPDAAEVKKARTAMAVLRALQDKPTLLRRLRVETE